MRGIRRLIGTIAVVGLALGTTSYLGCQGDVVNPGGGGGGGGDGGANDGPSGTFDNGTSVLCPNGTDLDGDGYGEDCDRGVDCDDGDRTINAGADEQCDGKDNNCDGTIDEGLENCNANNIGADSPFPVDPSKDDNVKEATGVNLDENGDLVLGANIASLGFMWIANTDDLKRGTLSKIDTKNLKEVARYLTVTCHSQPNSTDCVDANGKPIKFVQDRNPSRTAVDYNMDVWVANRCHDADCQPSSTKVANEESNCIDRNNHGKIDTSRDHDGNGQIETDCDDDGKPDTLATKCGNGKPPEFLSGDDECILFTVNYGDPGDIARSICLDAGKATIGASNAWVGTYSRPENGRGNNLYFKINGYTGAIEHTITLPKEHHAYGCMADGHKHVWSTDIGHYDHDDAGNLTYFETVNPYRVGKVLRGGGKDSPWKGANGKYRHYGIAVDAQQDLWLGGIDSEWVLRYKPDRTSFATMGTGTWTRIDLPSGFRSRGVATDNRNKVWVAIQKGAILRFDQTIADGVHDFSGIKEGKDYWPVTGREVIGVGVDIDLHIWAVGKSNSTASRLDVDDQGNVITPATGTTKNVKTGYHPYTYSDFTGFGLRNFVRPQGTWSYVHQPCPDDQKAIWKGVSWNATTPAGTAVQLRVRTGDSDATFGSWTQPFDKSPAAFGPQSASPVDPNPAKLLQLQFVLSNQDKKTTPILHDYAIIYTCVGGIG